LARVSAFSLIRRPRYLIYLPGRWLPSLRTFLASIDGSIEVDHYFRPSIQRDRDVYIMDLILHRDKEVRLINYCWLYLQAVTLSDLCLADGVSLDPAMLRGHPDTNSSTSIWIHITQARPNEASWTLWKRACTLWSCNNRLYHPLGDWKPTPSLCRQWPYYYDSADGALYVWQSKGFLKCVSSDPI
jgi:hypothetical protein